MMNNPKISVIVPVYNAESTIRRCVDSILAQTFTNFQVILVDDGSSDNSRYLCEEYSSFDDRVFTIHQANEGVIAARSVGVRKAEGEFIYFVDADDYIKKDTLETMYQYVEPDIDIIVFESDMFGCISRIEYTKQLLTFRNLTVWGKLYKKVLFDEYVMGVSRFFKVAEDFITNLRLLKNIHGEVRLIPENKYCYVENSATSVQLCFIKGYDYEKAVIEEVDSIVRGLDFYKDVTRDLFRWKTFYLGGMIGLQYCINYNDLWIKDLIQESRGIELTLIERVIVNAAMHKIWAISILVCQKKLSSIYRKLKFLIS